MNEILHTWLILTIIQLSTTKRYFQKYQKNGVVHRAVHSGGAEGAVAPARKTKCFFSNIVSDFAGLFLVAILVRNLTKTEFAPADKKS